MTMNPCIKGLIADLKRNLVYTSVTRSNNTRSSLPLENIMQQQIETQAERE